MGSDKVVPLTERLDELGDPEAREALVGRDAVLPVRRPEPGPELAALAELQDKVHGDVALEAVVGTPYDIPFNGRAGGTMEGEGGNICQWRQ